MTSRRRKIAAATVIGGWLAACPLAAHAAPVQWPAAQGGNNHSYEVFSPGSPTGWRAAQAVAQSKVGYLATITSPQEQAFIEQLLVSSHALTGAYWLGGELIDTEGPDGRPVYKWITNESFAYTHWDPSGGEPNGQGTAPRIAVIWTRNPEDGEPRHYERRGGWDDQYDEGLTRTDNPDIDQRGFIVERNFSGVGTPGPTPVPLPGAAAAGGLTLCGLAAASYVRRRAAKTL